MQNKSLPARALAVALAAAVSGAACSSKTDSGPQTASMAASNVQLTPAQRENIRLYTVAADGSFARQHVTLGYRSGDQYDIVDGLKAGDQIVIDGGIFVQFMQNQ